MSRVELVTADRAPLLAARYFAGGDPGPITSSLALVPEMLDVALPFLSRILAPSSIDLRTKELVIVRTSALQHCEDCTLTHAAVALEAGISASEVVALCDGTRPTPSAGEREAAILGWTDAVATGPGRVSEQTALRVRAVAADHEVVELTLLIGATLLLNRYCTALALPVGEGSLSTLVAAGLDPAVLADRGSLDE